MTEEDKSPLQRPTKEEIDSQRNKIIRDNQEMYRQGKVINPGELGKVIKEGNKGKK